MAEPLPDYWVVIPAGGIGKRMGAELPKQYLPIAGKTILEHTLDILLSHPSIKGIVVAIAAEDSYWDSLGLSKYEKIIKAQGGRERYESVANSLAMLTDAADDDWVLVHDAVRPCLTQHDIDCLLKQVATHPVGGLLAIPISDTVKRVDETQHVVDTLDRLGIWRALTPQMFRLGLLRDALKRAMQNQQPITDEAMAIEAYGKKPMIVKGNVSNIKITCQADLALAEYYLSAGLDQ